MTPDQFLSALKQLGLSQRKAAIAFGLSWRQINRYARGVTKIPHPLERLLALEGRRIDALEGRRRGPVIKNPAASSPSSLRSRGHEEEMN